VSSVSHRVSRKGTGFGSFVIQDYKGSQEFALFNEDYARFSPILLPGVSVLIEGDMKQKWNSEEFELKIKDVKQLASLGNSMTESITLMIPIEIITEGLIKELEQLCQKFKGKHKLKTHLIDERNRQTLHLFSTEKKVNVDSDFISAVEAKGLTYKLN
jgi:DNA polymerase-3 subunit alpha